MLSPRHLVHLCHVTGARPQDIDEMDLEDLIWWCQEAIEYWNFINNPEKGD